MKKKILNVIKNDFINFFCYIKILVIILWFLEKIIKCFFININLTIEISEKNLLFCFLDIGVLCYMIFFFC